MDRAILKATIKAKYGTVTAFANLMGWRQNTLYKVFHNERNLTEQELCRIGQLLDLSPQDFYDIFAKGECGK